MVTYNALREDAEIRTYIEAADAALAAQGYTEHSFAHTSRVAQDAGDLLLALGRDARTVELARIAALLHDIGNTVNRVDHSQSGALIAFHLLEKRGMPPSELTTVISAIGNHDEGTGVPVSDVAAALILADKCDVRRSRVRAPNRIEADDIHDRVNASVASSSLTLDTAKKSLTLVLEIDTARGSLMDFFEIFLERMLLCRRAAKHLGVAFGMRANGKTLL